MEGNKTEMSGLLEILAFKTSCMYLSDLRNPELLPAIQRAIQKIPLTLLSLWELCDAVEYIIGKATSFENVEEAALYLKQHCAKKK